MTTFSASVVATFPRALRIRPLSRCPFRRGEVQSRIFSCPFRTFCFPVSVCEFLDSSRSGDCGACRSGATRITCAVGTSELAAAQYRDAKCEQFRVHKTSWRFTFPVLECSVIDFATVFLAFFRPESLNIKRVFCIYCVRLMLMLVLRQGFWLHCFSVEVAQYQLSKTCSVRRFCITSVFDGTVFLILNELQWKWTQQTGVDRLPVSVLLLWSQKCIKHHREEGNQDYAIHCLGATSCANSIAIQILFCFDLTREKSLSTASVDKCVLAVLFHVRPSKNFRYCSLSQRCELPGHITFQMWFFFRQ